MTTSLVALDVGEAATVMGVDGGRSVTARLDGLGIRPGVRIVKTAGLPMRGPVTVRVGSATIAIGYGMALKVMVDSGRAGGA